MYSRKVLSCLGYSALVITVILLYKHLHHTLAGKKIGCEATRITYIYPLSERRIFFAGASGDRLVVGVLNSSDQGWKCELLDENFVAVVSSGSSPIAFVEEEEDVFYAVITHRRRWIDPFSWRNPFTLRRTNLRSGQRRDLVRGTTHFAISPSAGKIALIRELREGPNIWLMNRDSLSLRKVTSFDLTGMVISSIKAQKEIDERELIFPQCLAWLASSGEIIFGTAGSVESIRPDGKSGQMVKKTHGSVFTVDVSPDQTYLLYNEVSQREIKVYLMNLHSRQVKELNLGEFGSYPRWSSDSREVVFSKEEPDTGRFHLWILSVPSLAQHCLMHGRSSDTAPHWFFDSERIIFIRDQSAVCQVNSDGTGLEQLFPTKGKGVPKIPPWW